jgi:hypothetical protein
VSFLYFPQRHEGHKEVITNVEIFFVFLEALWDPSFEKASLGAKYKKALLKPAIYVILKSKSN